MLTKEQIEENKNVFLDLVKSINREGAEIDRLVNKLESSDFFTAPASTKYHASYEGGLCEHSLNVYNQLKLLYETEVASNNIDTSKYFLTEDSIKIVGLLHDLSKMNYYETAMRNVKDETGKWTSVPFVKVREEKDRFIFGNHEQNSLYMIEAFIPLNLEEEVAVLHHHAGMSDDSCKDNISGILNKYPLALFLHTADMLSCYLLERV